MIAAAWPRSAPDDERLLHVDPRRARIADACVRDLPGLLSPGDVLVVNDAATLPASLSVEGADVEVRLVMRLGSDRAWRAVLFGTGDFRTPTEHRSAPPLFDVGARLRFGAELAATITAVDADEPRLVDLLFASDGAALWSSLYRHGKPIQYAYVREPLRLFDVQTRYAARPWALKMPSAGRPLSWSVLTELRRRGVTTAAITHAAGISSTGSTSLDLRLPMRERYVIDDLAVATIRAAKARGGRVVAVGTTVVRALESSALEHDGELAAADDEATLLVGPGFRLRVVDAILSGMHPPGTSHFALLGAFAPSPLLARALEHAERTGYLEHEFGDSMLILVQKDP